MPEDKDKKETFEFEAEIFSVGTWNGDKYTDTDLQDMVDNFTKLADEVKPPIKLGHDPSIKGDGQPALGWVVGLRKSGDKLIAKFGDVPEVVMKVIKAKRFKRVSSEIYWNLKKAGKTFKRVLAGVALLGADIPAVTNLADLEVFMSQSPIDWDSADALKTYSFEQGEHTATKFEREDSAMDEATIKKHAEEKAELEAKLKKAEDEKADAVKKLSERDAEEAKRVEADARADFKAFCETAVKDGKLPPAAAAVLTDKHEYSDRIIFGVDTIKEFIGTMEKVLDTDEKGETGAGKEKGEYSNVGLELDAKVKEYMSDKKEISYSEAMNHVLMTDTDLAERYAKGGAE
jgi:hypothetical protein